MSQEISKNDDNEEAGIPFSDKNLSCSLEENGIDDDSGCHLRKNKLVGASKIDNFSKNDSSSQIKEVEKTLYKVVTPGSLLSVMSISGTMRLSCQQYDVFRNLINLLGKDITLPTYKTVKDTIWNHFLQQCLPLSGLYHVQNENETTKVDNIISENESSEGSDKSEDEVESKPITFQNPSEVNVLKKKLQKSNLYLSLIHI